MRAQTLLASFVVVAVLALLAARRSDPDEARAAGATRPAAPQRSPSTGPASPVLQTPSADESGADAGVSMQTDAGVAPSATEHGCPTEMARVAGFCVDRYEAHLVVRAADGSFPLHPHFERPHRGVVYEARSRAGDFPQAYVSRLESEAACGAAGKRLCSLAEWRRACEGDAHHLYPYGERFEPKRCNTEKSHLITLLFGGDPFRWHYEDFNDPRLDREPGFLARSGGYQGCVGEAGLHDMVGNVHEWVSDTVDAALLARLDAEGGPRAFQPWHPGNGVFVGGFFSTHEEHGPGCRFTTIAHEPGYHDYSTGFRCCADAAGETGAGR